MDSQIETMNDHQIKFREESHERFFLSNEEILEYLKNSFPDFHAAILLNFQDDTHEEMQEFLTNMREEDNNESALSDLQFLKGREVYDLFTKPKRNFSLKKIQMFSMTS